MPLTLQPYLHEEDAAHAKLEELVWPRGPVCLHCGAQNRIGSVKGKGARVALRFCCSGRKQFRATIGTVFESSHVPIHKWFQACFLLHCCEYQINSHQLAATIEVTYKTAVCVTRKLAITTAPRGVGDVRRRPPRQPIRSQQLFQRSVAALMLSEDEDQWMLPKLGSTQSANFVKVARRLRPIEDPGLFDSVLRKTLKRQGHPSFDHDT